MLLPNFIGVYVMGTFNAIYAVRSAFQIEKQKAVKRTLQVFRYVILNTWNTLHYYLLK